MSILEYLLAWIILLAIGNLLIKLVERHYDQYEDEIPESRVNYYLIAALERELYGHRFPCIGSPWGEDADVPQLIKGLEIDANAERQFRDSSDEWQDDEYRPGHDIS